MGKTWLLSEIRKAIDKDKEFIVRGKRSLAILDNSQRIKKMFLKVGHRYTEFDLKEAVELIADKLAPAIDVKAFLQEFILHESPPDEILDLQERLEKPQAKVSHGGPGCYGIKIGGKPGRPREFVLTGFHSYHDIMRWEKVGEALETLR